MSIETNFTENLTNNDYEDINISIMATESLIEALALAERMTKKNANFTIIQV
jgi:hypothetical protein